MSRSTLSLFLALLCLSLLANSMHIYNSHKQTCTRRLMRSQYLQYGLGAGEDFTFKNCVDQTAHITRIRAVNTTVYRVPTIEAFSVGISLGDDRSAVQDSPFYGKQPINPSDIRTFDVAPSDFIKTVTYTLKDSDWYKPTTQLMGLTIYTNNGQRFTIGANPGFSSTRDFNETTSRRFNGVFGYQGSPKLNQVLKVNALKFREYV